MKKYYVVTNEDVTLSGSNGYGSASVGVHIVGPEGETFSEMTVSESYEWFMQNINNIIDYAETPNGIILDSDVTNSSVKGLVTTSPIDIYSVDELTLSLKGLGSFYNRTISGGTIVRTLYLLDSSSNSNNERTEDMSLNTITPLTKYTFKVASIDRLIVKPGEIPVPDKEALTVTFEYVPAESLAEQNYEFVQTEELTEAGIAVQPYGAVIINTLAPSQLSGLYLKLKTAGGLLVADTGLTDILDGGVGTRVAFAPKSAGGGGKPEGT